MTLREYILFWQETYDKHQSRPTTYAAHNYQNNDNGKLRIYFLMYRMKSLLRTIPSDDPRAKDCIVLFETDEESDYKLTIIQKDLDVELTGNEIDGFRSYLEYWEATSAWWSHI